MAVTLAAAIPGAALAQPPNPPRVEVGVQASSSIATAYMQNDQERSSAWSPRITLNLTPSTAIEATADFRPPRSEYEYARISGQAYSLQWRQTLFTSGRWQVFGVLGAGGSRRKQEGSERVFEGRDGPEVFPAYTNVDSGLAAHLGPAVQFEAAPWLALRGDVRLTAGHGSGLRGMVGAVIPLGRFRAGDRPGLGEPTPPLADWQRVRPGREVWVTTSTGALVHGEISAISGRSLNLRQRTGDVTITLDDIRLVEGRDGLKNGIVIGGASGALGGGLLFTLLNLTFCESDDCAEAGLLLFAFGAASGAAVGGLLGAMVDGIIPGRQTLFERTSIRLVPVVTPTQKAVAVTVRWR